MSGLRFNPEYMEALASIMTGPPPPQATDISELRKAQPPALEHFLKQRFPLAEGIQEKVIPIKSHDGVDISITHFATDAAINSTVPLPAVIYVHGGGMISCNVNTVKSLISHLTNMSGVPLFAVEYRLAPEFPAPCAVEDVFCALKYVTEHAAELNVDPTRIAVMGHSAGGGLAAGTALLARDRNHSPPLAKQILVYPMLDDRTVRSEGSLEPEDPIWPHDYNVMAWNAYIGEEKRGKADADISPYAAPARAVSYKGLPTTYVEVGTRDTFRNEGMEYVGRLIRDNVEVEFHLWPGLPHGYEMVPTSWAARAMDNTIEAIKKIGV